jgi:hypothetical protein
VWDSSIFGLDRQQKQHRLYWQPCAFLSFSPITIPESGGSTLSEHDFGSSELPVHECCRRFGALIGFGIGQGLFDHARKVRDQ